MGIKSIRIFDHQFIVCLACQMKCCFVFRSVKVEQQLAVAAAVMTQFAYIVLFAVNMRER